jgi:hypothetical protein
MSEAAELNAEVHARAADFLAVCERSDGLRDVIFAGLERAVREGAHEKRDILHAAFSRIDKLPRPFISGDAGRRAQHAAAYMRRLA